MSRFALHRWKVLGEYVINTSSHELVCHLAGSCTAERDECGELIAAAPDMARLLKKISEGHYVPATTINELLVRIEKRNVV